MNEIKRELLTSIGTELAGGFYTGIIQTDGKHYALITAPKELELTGEWGEYRNDIPGASSTNNCHANTIAMAEAGSELAQKVALINHAGFKDWTIPSRDALEIMYRSFKPTKRKNCCTFRDGDNPSSVPPGLLYQENSPQQTAVDAFKSGAVEALNDGWYWSSTQHRAYLAYWQDFSGGVQLTSGKDFTARVRPVRRLLIS